MPTGLNSFTKASRGSIWSLSAAVVLLLAVLTISLVYDRMDDYNVFSLLIPGHWNAITGFFLVFFSGALFGMFGFGIASKGWTETVSCFWKPIAGSGILIAGVGTLVFSLLVWAVSSWTSNGVIRLTHFAQHDPGGLFAAFMGLVTIVGFAFTLHDLREMRRRITTFPDLIDRLTSMLSEEGDDVIRFLAYTPALGYIALEDREFKKFYDAMRTTGTEGMPRLHMTCLNKDDLTIWHDLFKGRRTRRKQFENPDTAVKEKAPAHGLVDAALAQAATKMGEHMVENIEHEVDLTEDTDGHVKRLPFEFLPGYYFFVSSSRAIVVAPLQLPFPKGAPRTLNQQRSRTVQMLGFETNDRSIINDLSDFYDSYKTLPSSYVAQCSDVMSADQITNWCNNIAQKTGPDLQKASHFSTSSSAIAELLRQFEIASGNGTTKPQTKEDMRLREDYLAYIDPEKLAQTKLEVMFRVSLRQE